MERLSRFRKGAPPRLGERLLLAAAVPMTRLAALGAPGQRRREAWRELWRALTAFRLFRLAPALLESSRATCGLNGRIERLRSQDVFRGLWVVEGLGHRLAEDRHPSPALLGDQVTRGLPAGCLVPLHAGMGLTLAQAQLFGPDSVVSSLAELLHALDLGSTSGCAGVATEGIGLLVRTLLPDRLRAFDDAFRVISPERRGLFWHGVGRALYFLFPRALMRGKGWPGWHRVQAEVLNEDEEARLAARAGFVWPLCLVNVQEPGVVESFLAHHGQGLDEHAFRHGLVGATLTWHAWAGRDVCLDKLLGHASAAVALRWEERVRAPVEEALEVLAPRLERSRRFEELLHPQAEPLFQRLLERSA